MLFRNSKSNIKIFKKNLLSNKKTKKIIRYNAFKKKIKNITSLKFEK